jgi:hypothetical protein
VEVGKLETEYMKTYLKNEPDLEKNLETEHEKLSTGHVETGPHPASGMTKARRRILAVVGFGRRGRSPPAAARSSARPSRRRGAPSPLVRGPFLTPVQLLPTAMAWIGSGSGLPMATAVVVMLVPMEAVVVAATRRRCDGGVCGGTGALLPRRWWRRRWMPFAESNTENGLRFLVPRRTGAGTNILRGHVKSGPGSEARWRREFEPTTG